MEEHKQASFKLSDTCILGFCCNLLPPFTLIGTFLLRLRNPDRKPGSLLPPHQAFLETYPLRP